MKYGKVLKDPENRNPAWEGKYLDYDALKDLIKECVESRGQSSHVVSFSPRQTSLTVLKRGNRTDTAGEKFFRKLEDELKKIELHTDSVMKVITSDLSKLKSRVRDAMASNQDDKKKDCEDEADRIANEFLALEKYVNLNYMGFHKILKKHDKMLPEVPCRQFYIQHLHSQPWVEGRYSNVLVELSGVHSQLRNDPSGTKNEDQAQDFTRSTTKYWVELRNISEVKRFILAHLPVFQHDPAMFQGDSQMINSVYFDNQSLELYHGRLDKRPNAIALRFRWYGGEGPQTVFIERKTHRESWKNEESVKERFILPEDKVLDFMTGKYTVDDEIERLRAKGKSEKEIGKVKELFEEIQKTIDSKQLNPFIRTQYDRTAFQIPYDSTVRVSLDTNLVMMKENPDGMSKMTERWYRDPDVPVRRDEYTKFPHAVLEIKLSLRPGMQAPGWVQELLASNYLTEVHKFSKFIHGTCTLFPDMVQAVPYWIDDESIRSSMLESAPTKALLDNGGPAAVVAQSSKPRRAPRAAAVPDGTARGDDDLRHPLLGDRPNLKLISDAPAGFGRTLGGGRAQAAVYNILNQVFGFDNKPRLRSSAMRIEPKTFFANERTYLSWLHMAVTIGGIATALLGFTATQDRPKGFDSETQIVEIICMILLPVAVLMCGYAIVRFTWRATRIAKKQAQEIDDKYGPLGLAIVVVAALTAIFIVSLVDFFSLLHSGGA